MLVSDLIKAVEAGRNRMKNLEYYTVENTGWSGGISWFKTGGTDANPLRFKTEADATTYALERQAELNQSTTFWRVIRTTVEREQNREVVTKTWTEL